MNILARGWFWMLDYAYAGYRQTVGLAAGAGPSSYLGGEGQPVLLLPGIYETWQFMRPVADELHAHGHPVHVVTGLGRNQGTVQNAARIVADYLAEQDLHDVIVVAHSKGGLIGKFLMMTPDLAQGRVDRMVAIASPFSGSSLARFTVLPSLRAMAPGDPTIRILTDELFVNARITSIFGTFDPHIPGGSELPGATNIRVPVAGHFRPISDRRLLDAVASACAAPPS